ncbi:MAG: ABC transporter substrate-binding protein [Nitrososphaerales archaeon]
MDYTIYDSETLQNVYEPLLWFNGSSSTQVIPWLAQSYTVSSDQRTVNFTLRSGINFADGEPLNSTAVYFSLNRLLILDGSTPLGHGTQAAWLIQQLLNTSLSSNLGGAHNYTQAWANQVLAQDFVQVTGPMTFTLHIQHPNAAFVYLLANSWAFILAPNYVMHQDLALWNASSSGYSLPHPSLTGVNETDMINQYFMDEVSTCDSGLTPKGCGTTYLDGSYYGSMAGTGPYILESIGQTTNNIVLKSNPNYWGGPYQSSGGSKITPKIQTININYVPNQETREIDLRNAAQTGAAFTIDVTGDHLFDVADRNAWLNNGTMISIIPGVTLYGPYSSYSTAFDTFGTNITNPQTGGLYTFQPFSDLRFRLAFADSVNLSEINQDINNRLGQVANDLIPPGLPPNGAYNSSLINRYSFNQSAVQNLLVDAMLHPLTHFTLANGTTAGPGIFNNTFGCSALNANGKCDNPVTQLITMYYVAGDSVNAAIDNQIASVINNVSVTYNMGLSVNLTPYPIGQMFSLGFSGHLYFFWAGWTDDYPWSTDFLGPMLAPNGAYTGPDSWNLTSMATLYKQAVAATQDGNITGVVKVTGLMNQLSNQGVLYLLLYYPLSFNPSQTSVVGPITSNVHGFFYNPSLNGLYFATLY